MIGARHARKKVNSRPRKSGGVSSSPTYDEEGVIIEEKSGTIKKAGLPGERGWEPHIE